MGVMGVVWEREGEVKLGSAVAGLLCGDIEVRDLND